ncbi:MAG: D-isomer specific 2-hydroxyacid dehydrogenase family protein [Oscillospiraceae bacterium]|nr:D-isomer specific 2-hydroxyacid dehydrogenase family protein [Oscillospiraceae bacterium]
MRYKVAAFSYRQDEIAYFEKFCKDYDIDLVSNKCPLTLETAHLAQGCKAVSIITTATDAVLLQKLADIGVEYISTRTIGYDHIDIESAKKLHLHIGHVNYSPYSVADYTVMLLLMTMRKIGHIIERAKGQDFSLKNIQSPELHNLTVGVIGTGRIGSTVIQELSGFGCPILAYDTAPNATAAKYASYVALDELFAKADIITLHAPALDSTYHMINAQSINKMKDGVMIINTARGSLINSADLIDAIESGKVGAAGLDVVENETDLFYFDHKYKPLSNREMAVLKSFPNVTVLPHTAFYTNQAVSDMVENSLKSCRLYFEGAENPFTIV